ncbi:hypothetical protein ACFYNL_20925 [Streptomyces sp. NPDC007808]|uniref:hypothetical protein n=1 Tax=Streptomyces sp. NPDC007808 TaxID=3364779 RepID=UPI00369F22E2
MAYLAPLIPIAPAAGAGQQAGRGRRGGTAEGAAVIKSALWNMPGVPITALKGPVLADAGEPVLTAPAREPGMPVLAGLRIEASHEAITLTATDRYRLSTRTLVPTEPPR